LFAADRALWINGAGTPAAGDETTSARFLRPVRGEIVTECIRPDATAIEHFIERYRQRGKARWAVEVTVRAEGGLAMTFNGDYGVFKSEQSRSFAID
jgi:hypothetical protein